MARPRSHRHRPPAPDAVARSLAGALAAAASARQMTIATAESCTGGLIGAALTSRPGSSDWYLGGVVSYSDAAKSVLLGVSPDLIERHGAVSGEVAAAMARGARASLGARLAIAVTGIAGPGGAVPGKPLGTVWLGVDSRFGTDATCHHFAGDRDAVRNAAVRSALLVLIAWTAIHPGPDESADADTPR